jgi:hypothetical protein
MMTSDQRHRVLVVANETVASATLHEALESYRSAAPDVLVLAPALNSRLRHWLSDHTRARQDAATRLSACLAALQADGISAEGVVGDADPIQAIDDTLRVFPAAEIVIATHPESRSNWLARDVVARACTTFGLPVVHVVVDERAALAARAA